MNIRWLSHAQAWIYYMMKTLFLWQLIFHVAAGSGCFPFVPFDSSFTWWWWIFHIYKSSWKPTQFSTLSCGNEGRVSLLWRRVDGVLEKGTDKAVKVIHSSSVWSPAQVMHDVDKFIKWNVILAFQFVFFFFQPWSFSIYSSFPDQNAVGISEWITERCDWITCKKMETTGMLRTYGTKQHFLWVSQRNMFMTK